MDLAAARAQLLSHLDDDGTRWSTTEQDRALAWALDSCLRELIGAGNSRLETHGSFTSGSTGLIDVSTHVPFSVQGVSLQVGQRYFRIPEIKPEERNILDDTARTYLVRYTKGYVLPTNSAHPLVGVGSTAAQTWDALEHWIIVRAAIMASAKDAEERPDLVRLEQMARDAAMLDPHIPKTMRFPGPGHWYTSIFAWYWLPDVRKIQVVRRV